MRFALAIAAALSVSVTAARAGNIDLGTVELSGSAGFYRSSTDYSSQADLYLSPSVAVYLAPFVNIGPVLGWSFYTTDYEDPDATDYSANTLDLGLKVGFLVNWSNGFGRPLPYFDFGSGGTFINQSGLSTSSHNGFFFTGTTGVKLKIGECFYLSLFERYNHNSVDYIDNEFTSGVGFSGLIGR
jgi:hypothetical protein